MESAGAKKTRISFLHNGELLTVSAVRSNDCFFEIIGGRHNGNLVHVFEVVKKKTAIK